MIACSLKVVRVSAGGASARSTTSSRSGVGIVIAGGMVRSLGAASLVCSAGGAPQFRVQGQDERRQDESGPDQQQDPRAHSDAHYKHTQADGAVPKETLVDQLFNSSEKR